MSDLRFIYLGGGMVIALLLVLVILLARGGSKVVVSPVGPGPTGPAMPPASGVAADLWAKLIGYRTHVLIVAYVALRWGARQGYIDQATFDDIDIFILGGAGLTVLNKLNRQEQKLEANTETVKVAASAAKVAAVRTDELIKQTGGASDGKTPAAGL